MTTFPRSDIEAFAARLATVGDPFPTRDEHRELAGRQLICAFADGRFEDALPFPFYSHLMTWVADQLASGAKEVVLSLPTVDGGYVSFLYDVRSDESGIYLGPAIEYSVPADGVTDLDPEFLGKPATIVDVASLRGLKQTA
jgi:hypothetical protein